MKLFTMKRETTVTRFVARHSNEQQEKNISMQKLFLVINFHCLIILNSIFN